MIEATESKSESATGTTETGNRRRRDRQGEALDAALEQTFPASDPIALCLRKRNREASLKASRRVIHESASGA